MEITVSEALRLKNEIAKAVQLAQYKTMSCSYGTTKEGDVEIDNTNDNTFTDALIALERVLGMSLDINDAISAFNRKHGVDSLVRQKENTKMLVGVFEKALKASKESTTTRFETVGNNRISVTRTFKPFLASKDIKDRIKKTKADVRKIQSEIETLNNKKIKLPFEWDDIDGILEA